MATTPKAPNAKGATRLDAAMLRILHAARTAHPKRSFPALAAELAFAEGADVLKDRYRRAAENGALTAALADAPQPGAPTVEPTGERVAWAETASGATAESPRSGRIRTLDDLLAAAEVDLSRWEVERFVVNKWEVGASDGAGGINVEPLWQVKAWLKPAAGAAALAAVADAVAAMVAHAPAYTLPSWPARNDAGDLLLEVNLSDAHLGMLAWHPETGTGDYDIAIARRDWQRAIAEIIERARGRHIAEIILPIGNDFLHCDATIDGKGGATTKGTPQDVDGRWQRMVKIGREVLVETIDALRLIAPVRVRVVPGNHDQRTMVLLGEVMAAWYRNDPAVTVENEPDPFSCFEWGVVFLGYCHGHGAKDSELPMIMARKWPEAWGRTRWREWHRGHKHRASAVGLPAPRTELFEDQGVRVVGVPGLTAEDEWAASHGYYHLRAAEARIWSKRRGPMDLFTVWIESDEEQAA